MRCLVTERDPIQDTAETFTMREKEVEVTVMVTRRPGVSGSPGQNHEAGVGAGADTGHPVQLVGTGTGRGGL